MKIENWVKTGLWIGAIYDILLGVGIIFFLKPMSTLFDIPYPEYPIFPQTLGLFLIAMGILLIDTSRNPKAKLLIPTCAFSVRAFYLPLCIINIYFSDLPRLFLLIAFTDLITGFLFMIPLVIQYKDLFYRIFRN